MAKNPDWSSVETAVLLENYQTREMHKLQEILTKCYFPRPPEGIKRQMEKLYAAGMPLDLERIRHLSIRKLWDKKDHQKFNEQLHRWRENNPTYFNRWFKEHPNYLNNWFKQHKGYWRNFLQRHPDYWKRYKLYIRKNFDKVFLDVFRNKQDLPFKDVYAEVKNLTGLPIKARTLEKLLLKYENKPRGMPIIRTETGNYKINTSYYQN